MKLKLNAFILLICLSSCSDSKKSNKEFTPSFKKSEETTHEISKDQAYTFGYLEVLENRSDPKSKTIKLPVYIFKSRSKTLVLTQSFTR